MSHGRLDRRAVLRGAVLGGAAAVVPLPRLCAMLDGNGVAYADGTPLRKVFGTWFFGNGVVPPRWVPTSTGPGWELSEELAPLAKVKRAVTVVTGLELKSGTGAAHAYGPAGILTGANHGPGTTVKRPSIDQIVAGVIGNETRYRSLEVGVTKATPNASGSCYFNISHRGPNAPNPPEFDARKVFARLFADAPGADPRLAKLAVARRSVLDAVATETTRFSATLGAEDRQRLDQHLEGIRALERRISRLPSGVCATPEAPTAGPDTRAEAPPELNAIMADLVATALSCDLTRVFSFLFSYPAAHVYFRHLGLTQDFHDDICHKEPGDQPSVHRGVVYTMQSFAVLLEKLQSIKEGAGTLLDAACIMATSCVSWGRSHAINEYPIVIAGRAGGGLRGDLHHRSTTKENTTKVLLTLANVMGAGLASFGQDGGLSREELPAIRV